MNETKAKLPAAGRPRSEKSREAVMTAAMNLLRAKGYRELTMEGIAKEAGVGKPTLYRWWPGVPFIVVEALKHNAESEICAPDTGELARDVEQYLQSTCRALTEGSGDIMRSLMAEAQFVPAFADLFRESFISSRRQTLIRILERGAQRGELAKDADHELIADLCYGPIWYRLLNKHTELDDSFVRSLARAAVRA
jgi:AcrR family transcriptional regulator